ncbi:MAG: hypothetical protein WBG86_02135 [Polyangiales bacterium]
MTSEKKGEGNAEAGRRYRSGVKETLEEGNVDEDAQAAKEAVKDSETRPKLEESEERAKKGPRET